VRPYIFSIPGPAIQTSTVFKISGPLPFLDSPASLGLKILNSTRSLYIILPYRMRLSHVLALLPLAALTSAVSVMTPNGHCSGDKATGDWKKHGICIRDSTCTSSKYKGKHKDDACPYDADNIKCCLIGLETSYSTNPCGGSSYCTWRANGCAGTWVTGIVPPYTAIISTAKQRR
jgi:hypothetical protein